MKPTTGWPSCAAWQPPAAAPWWSTKTPSEQANRLVCETTAVRPSHTGSAGLAGLLHLQRQGVVAPGARVGVLLTGVQR